MQLQRACLADPRRWMIGLCGLALLSVPAWAAPDDQPHLVVVSTSPTTLSGYVSTSAIWMFGHDHQLYGRVFDDASKQDGFNLDVARLTLERPLDDRPWSAGYKA